MSEPPSVNGPPSPLSPEHGSARIGPTGADTGPAPWIRWLAVPYALLVVMVAALALRAESRESFVERQGDREAIERLTDDEIPFDATRIVIETPEGTVEITADGERIVGRQADGSAEVLRLFEDPNGDIIGFRLDPDGTFSPVRAGDDTEGATLLIPNAGGGFDLVKPDGSRVRVDVDNGELAAGEIGENGFTPLPRNEDGSFRLGDDLFASPTGPLDSVNGPAPSAPGAFPWTEILIALAAAAALGLGIWFFIAFSPRLASVRDVPVDQLFVAPVIRREETSDPWAAFEAYLVELATEPDPSQAILLAFSYAESGIGTLPPRDPEETPYEWLRRAQTIDPAVSDLLTPLLERYVAIRFGGHLAEDAERRRAIADLRRLTHAACGVDDPLSTRPA